MRSLIALLAAGALALSACTSDDPTIGPSPGAAGNGAGENGNGAGENGNGEGGGGGGGNQPPPEVQPSMIPPGEPTTISTEVLGRGTDPTNEVSRPRMVLVRNRNRGQSAADGAPIEEAGEILRGWDQYAQQAIIAVYGGAQPDAGHRLRIHDVSVTRGGRHVTVFGAIVRRGEAAAEVISMPWQVLAVPAGAVAVAQRCILALDGQTPRSTPC